MKLRHLLLASAVSVAFGASAFAQQDQDMQSGQQGQTSAAQSGSQHDMQSMQNDPQMVRQLQQKLKDQGYDVGQVDGKWGPQTKNALKQWQQSQGMEGSGKLDQQSLSALGIQGGDGMGGDAQGATAGRDSMSGSQGSTGATGTGTSGTGTTGTGGSTGAGAAGAGGAGGDVGAGSNTGAGGTSGAGGAAGTGGGAGR